MKVIWHDVECGGYAADLALWEELADGATARSSTWAAARVGWPCTWRGVGTG